MVEANRWRGGPFELYLDEGRGMQTPGSRETGDEDELDAHGPDGDGSLQLSGGDGETLVEPATFAGDEVALEEEDDTDDFWWPGMRLPNSA